MSYGDLVLGICQAKMFGFQIFGELEVIAMS